MRETEMKTSIGQNGLGKSSRRKSTKCKSSSMGHSAYYLMHWAECPPNSTLTVAEPYHEMSLNVPSRRSLVS